MDKQSDEQLHWDAFRYVAGEMSGAEEGQFQHRLSSDQPAREAVAEAVELAQAVALAVPPQPSPVNRPGGRARARGRWLGVAVAAAACAMLVAALGFLLGSNPPWRTDQPARQTAQDAEPASRGAAQGRSSDEADELATHWSELREREHDLAGEFEAELGTLNEWPLESEGFASDGFASGDSETLDGETPAAAPDWMLAAVAGVNSQDDMRMDDVERHQP